MISMDLSITNPRCHNMEELPSAMTERTLLYNRLSTDLSQSEFPESLSPLERHLSYGLAYTVGSALGTIPPSAQLCLDAFTTPNKVGLTAGARAWSKHSHRSHTPQSDDNIKTLDAIQNERSAGWWGTPSGPVAMINERRLCRYSGK